MRSTKHDPPSPILLLCAHLLLVSALRAQERCAVEVKLLLSPTETQTANASLNVGKETTGRVYFFDTSSLDLLSAVSGGHPSQDAWVYTIPDLGTQLKI